jgi:endogenous inhibitor of DNA gyrase (YacG/DUF329 family)
MKKVRCPICDRAMPGPGPREWPHWPFCSRRCQVIDLGRWLGGAYRIPAPPQDDPDQDGADASDDVTKPAVPSADPHSEAP